MSLLRFHIFLYIFVPIMGGHQIGCYPIVLPLSSISSSISFFPQWLIITISDAVFGISIDLRLPRLTLFGIFEQANIEYQMPVLAMPDFENILYINRSLPCWGSYFKDEDSEDDDWSSVHLHQGGCWALTLKMHQSSSTSRETQEERAQLTGNSNCNLVILELQNIGRLVSQTFRQRSALNCRSLG